MQLGSVPVFIYYGTPHIPFSDVIDWNQLAILVEYKNINNIDNILKSISKQKYQFDVWYPQKFEKTFGKVEKDRGRANYFKFDGLTDGEIQVSFQTPNGIKKSSMDLDRLKLFLYHPELF
jgi:hypothetical protein